MAGIAGALVGALASSLLKFDNLESLVTILIGVVIAQTAHKLIR